MAIEPTETIPGLAPIVGSATGSKIAYLSGQVGTLEGGVSARFEAEWLIEIDVTAVLG